MPMAADLKFGAGTEHFVLFIGSCGTCSLKHIDASRIPVRSFQDVALVVFGSEREVPKSFEGLGKNVRIVCDPAGSMHKSWNATFQPRWYILSSSGKLIDFQHNIASDRYRLAR
jgi:hypothetical protein